MYLLVYDLFVYFGFFIRKSKKKITFKNHFLKKVILNKAIESLRITNLKK